MRRKIIGLTIERQDERGRRLGEYIADMDDRLHELLLPLDDTSFHCLRIVDWYGDTVFNQLQIDTVIEELQRIRASAKSVRDKALLDDITRLAEMCKAQMHTYLKFIGD